MLNNLNREQEALKLLKKYVGIKEDTADEIFQYQIFDKQYISLRSSLVILKEEYELLKEILNEK